MRNRLFSFALLMLVTGRLFAGGWGVAPPATATQGNTIAGVTAWGTSPMPYGSTGPGYLVSWYRDNTGVWHGLSVLGAGVYNQRIPSSGYGSIPSFSVSGVGTYTLAVYSSTSSSTTGSPTGNLEVSQNINVVPANNPPTVSWVNNPATAYVNQWFTVQARGDDPDGNITTVFVWRDGQPFAFNGFPSGYTQYSDNNAAMSSVPGTITFMAQSSDSNGATSGYIYHTVTIVNRPPLVTMSASPTTIEFGQSTNLSSTATDPDGNLAFHGILVLNETGDNWYRSIYTDHSTGWGNHPTTTDFTSISYSSGVASGSSSLRTAVHRPSYTGLPRTITYHNNAYDGYMWASSDPANWAACVGYATVLVNKATPTQSGWAGQSWTGTGTAPAGSFNVSILNPYSSAVTPPSGAPTFSIVSASGAGVYPTSGPVTAGTVFYPGSYVIRCSYAGDTNYNARDWDVPFTVANVAPTAGINIKGATSGATNGVMGEVLTISVSGADSDGNLRAVNLWVFVPSVGYWRNIRADSTLNGAFVENTTTDNAINSGGANVASLGAVNRTFTVALGGGTGTYQFVVRSLDATSTQSLSQEVDVTVGLATQPALAVSAAASQTYRNSQTLGTTGGAGSGGVSYAIVAQSSAGVATLSGAVLTANAGSGWVEVQATKAGDGNYNATTSAVFHINLAKAPLTITADAKSRVYNTANPTLTASYSGLVGGDTSSVVSGLVISTTAVQASNVSAYPDYPITVSGASAANYTITFVPGTLTVSPQPATFTFSQTSPIYTGAALSPVVTISPAGATWGYKNPPPAAPPGTTYATGAILKNSYYFQVEATGNYTGTGDCNWSIICCTAIVNLGNLTGHTYNGSPQSATATTSNPSGLNVAITYNGSLTVPTAAGTYAVHGEISAPVDQYGQQWGGHADGQMIVALANQGPLTLSATASQTYGTTLNLSTKLTASGSGNGTISYAIIASSSPSIASISGTTLSTTTGTGWVDIQATKATGADGNYNPTTSNTMRVTFAKATQTGLLFNPTTPATYGTTQTLSATGGSAGAYSYAKSNESTAGVVTLTGTQLTINSGTGSVNITATRAGDNNYNAISSVVPVTLAKATAPVVFGNLNQIYDGTAKTVTATTTPAGLAVTLTYNGSASGPVEPNSYSVAATVVDTNYQGSTGATLKIDKATPTITWPTPAAITFGTALSATQLNATASKPGTFVYTPASGTFPSGGTQTLSVAYTPTDTAHYLANSSSVSLTVNKAAPVGTFLPRNWVSSHLIVAADLNATFAHATPGAFAAPTGTISYSIVSATGAIASPTSGAVAVGTNFQPGVYTIRASYVGNTNYSAATVDTSFTIILDPLGDYDNDGMPNGWEQAHGLNPYSSADANGDPDGDGFTNVAEYNLGTDPNVYNAGTSTQGNSATPGGWPNSGINPTVAVGATAGQLAVDKSGAMTYAVPLWTTPGTAGVEPKLSLNYSSQAGNGVAGLGWSLSGASAITRGPQTLAIDGKNLGVTITGSDRFYLDGQRLVLISGTYGAAGSEYRTEIDSFSKIVAYGSRGTGPAYFKAWTKAGLIIEFGNTADSAFDAYGHAEALNWSVNKISDTVGNFMTYSYDEDAPNGVHRLSRIDYTGNGTTVLPYASVQLEYEDRPDWTQGMVAGSPVGDLKRLKYIRAYYGTSVARTYTLAYRVNAGDQLYVNRSVLTSLTETGSDGTSYPALTFGYATTDSGWDARPAYVPPDFLGNNLVNNNQGWPSGTGTGFMDLNGDGRVDFIKAIDTTTAFYRNDGTTWVADSSYLLPYPLAAANATITDTGSRFVDLNGDGLVDYVYKKYGSDGSLQQNEVWLNNGAGWTNTPAWRLPAPVARDGTQNDDPLRGGRFIDINNDGRPDFVAFMSNGTGTTNLAVYLNNGSGWDALHTGYSTVSDNLAKYKAQFIDLNGDGLPDIAAYYVEGTDILQKTWLNTGSGWTESTAYRLPQPIADKNDPSVGAEFVDVNGDGLPDLVWYREGTTTVRGVAINTGLGWTQSTDLTNRYAPAAPLSRDGYKASGAAVMDLNADGIPDIVCSRDFGGGTTPSQFINFGSLRDFPGATSTAQNLPLYLLQGTIPNIGVDFVDFDGDGVVDVLWNRIHADGSTFSGADHNKVSPITDRLIKVTNGLGVAASVTYKSLMDSTVYTKGVGGPAGCVNAIGPMYVVSEIGNDDGAGGQYNVDYAYSGLRSDRIRGSLGFETMTVTDSRTLIQSQTTYAQVYPFIGMPLESKTVSGAVTLSDTLVSYGQVSLNSGATRFVFAADSLTSTHDLDGSATGTVDTSVAAADIDTYGNIAKIVVNTDGFTKTTTSTYDNDTTNWFLGRLRTATVDSAAPAQPTITRTSSFSYNTAGLLQTETVEAGNANLSVTTGHAYDQFGNQNSVTVSGANITVATDGTTTPGAVVSRTTSTNYDSNGRFPINTTNALLHSETYDTYDQVLGVLKQMSGANGLVTTWDYDGMGRKIHEHRADGTDSYTNYRWVSGAPSQAEYYGGAETAKYSVENTATGSAPTLAFYDSFGRAFLGLGIAGDGKIIYQTTQYDANGRAFAKSVPYFASSNGLPHAYWATTGFDLLNRPVTVTTPDEEASGGQVTSSSAYYGLQATATDPKGRVARTIKNSQGWTTQNTRNENAAGGATASTVTYGYDAIGNLTSTVADGSTTTLAYDLRGRKTSMVDPDMGTWQYRYNIFGELIWQKDAKGQITTMAYDALGRLTSRAEPEGPTTWTYDTAVNGGGVWKGKLASVSSPGGYLETYDYDSVGRPSTIWRTIPGVSNTTVEPRFFVTQTYDSAGRPLKTIYPSGFQTTNVYNDFGYLKEVRRADSNRNDVYWMADTYSVTGRVDGEYYGNGLINDRVYSEATGRLRTAAIGKGIETTAPFSIQYLQYNYDAVGNVTTRSDGPTTRTESFSYDGLDRLLTHALVGYSTVSVTYNPNGNIASKSDVGNYAYTGSGPHALSGVSGGTLGAQNYLYDANGNMTSGGGRTITWTSFNQVKRVQNSGNTFYSDFTFGAGHERIKEVAHNATTVFIGALFERVTSGSLIENKHYIYSPTGRIAVRTERNDTTVDTRYFHTDGLGSITAVTNEAGQIVKRFAFDAWGKRVDPSTNGVITSTTNGKFTRGYTDHEQLDDLGLIHMNGRVYDPVLGRFLSADPNVDGVSDAQGYNRYSYVGNNPLGATDPTGFFSLKDVGGAIVGIVVAVVVIVAIVYSAGAFASFGTFFSSISPALANASLGQLALAGAAGGFASGFSGSLLNGGSLGGAFKSGLIGAATGAATAWAAGVIGHEFGAIGSKGPWNEVGRALAHGAAGGAITEASGGEFRHGFYAGFAGSAAGSLAPSLHLPGYDIRTGSAIAERTAFAAVVGGTASVLGGGKFANGAVTSAFQHLFNAEAEGIIKNKPRVLVLQEAELAHTTSFQHGIGSVTQFERWIAARIDINDELKGDYLDYSTYSGKADLTAQLKENVQKYDIIVVASHGNTLQFDTGSFKLINQAEYIGSLPTSIVDKTQFWHCNTRTDTTDWFKNINTVRAEFYGLPSRKLEDYPINSTR